MTETRIIPEININQPESRYIASGLFAFLKGQNMSETLKTETKPAPEGYVSCKTCGHILGFKAHIGKAFYLFVYANPAPRCRPNLPNRRVSTRVLDGAAYCCNCDTWQEWELERPWEKERQSL